MAANAAEDRRSIRAALGASARALGDLLPHGRGLPDANWEHRHRWMLAFVWFNAAALLVYGLLSGLSLAHALVDSLPVATLGALAALGTNRKVRAALVATGLLTASALLVHVSGGYIEAHFHFFVMIAVLTLYEDWVPFSLATAYVVIHHAVLGVIAPGLVYNHPDAVAHPVKWALIHGGFVMAAGTVAVILWRLNEGLRDEQSHRALHDPLTGLPNRALFLDRLSHALRRAARSDSTVAVLTVAIDRFKVITDSLGRDAGDKVLTLVAARLPGAVRRGDTVARVEGDAFTILCEEVDGREGAIRVAQRVHTDLLSPVEVAEREYVLSVSVGIALSEGVGEDAGTLLQNADSATYCAKEAGGARYEVFDRGMRNTAIDRLEVEHQVRRGLRAGEFCLHYQPIVALDDGRLEGVEALIRWHRPGEGLVPPGAFIPFAEETILIVEIGEWVLREACSQAAAWRADLGDIAPLPVHVNVAARQLTQTDLPGLVARVLAETGLSPADLALEITETGLLENSDLPKETLEQLRAMGVAVVLDDFGKGYSSLSYVERFPIEALKIDRAFVARLGGEDPRSAIVEAIVGMARGLDLTVVAEGVETAAQADRVRELGCGLAQGYYYARPGPASEISLLVDRDRAAHASSTPLP